MNMDTNQNPFYQNLNEIYQEREKLFRQREEEYLKQKNGLNNLFEVIKQEKSELERAAKEQEKKREELKKEEQNQQTWYQQICEERKQIDMERGLLQKEQQEFQAKKDAAEVQYRVQLEKAKNEGIQAQQKKEEFEHKLDMLGLMLDANGEPGKESAQFFESLLGGTEKIDQEELQTLEEENKACQEKIQELEEKLQNLEEDNEELRDKNEKLQNEVETLSQNIQKAEEEKNRLLTLVSNISMNKEEETEEAPKEEDVPNFGTTEGAYVPTFGRKEKETHEEVFEELTASVLQNYLSKNEAKYISSEIKHSEDGEQLHVNINNLDYAFIFSQPAAFDISTPKKKSRELNKVLVRLNTQHPTVKFRYDEQEGKVYASGYFSNTMTPENLMNKVHEVSDCFRQK